MKSCFFVHELKTLKVYDYLIKLPHDIGITALSPMLEFISLELRWTGGVLLADEPDVHELPIRLRRSV